MMPLRDVSAVCIMALDLAAGANVDMLPAAVTVDRNAVHMPIASIACRLKNVVLCPAQECMRCRPIGVPSPLARIWWQAAWLASSIRKKKTARGVASCTVNC